MDITAEQVKRQSSVVPMAIIGILFFLFGFVTWLNGSLIPFLRIVCDLNEFQALFVTFAFYIAYFVMALPMSFVLNKVGLKNGMVVGLVIMAIGAVLFIPAAQTAQYGLFLVALFTLGIGLTILQTASNPYIVCIGPRESAAMRISIMGLVNKGAGIVVPALFTAFILTGMDQFDASVLDLLSEEERATRLAELSNRLVTPYIYMTVVLLALAAFVKFSPLPELDVNADSHGKDESSWFDIFGHPQLILGFVALFSYVGVEVIAGDTIGLFGQGLGVANFGALTSYTMTFMVFGYLIGVVFIPKYLTQSRALLGSAVLGLVFTLGVMFGSVQSKAISSFLFGWAGIPVVPDTIVFLALLGFANALVWPAIWPLALEGLGKLTATGSALLIMGIAGGGALPLLYGYIAHQSGNSQAAYWIMLPCYLFILFYALKGHKLRSWK